jgi:hypothetical protein
MERSVFSLPKVASILRQTVEARLHTDKSASPLFTRMREVQTRFSGTRALPVYVVIDAQSETVVDRWLGATTAEKFATWLDAALKKPING